MKYVRLFLLMMFVVGGGLFFSSSSAEAAAGYGSVNTFSPFEERLLGRILLQVEDNGEAWYVSTEDARRYYLGRPDDAFTLMRELGLGITNADLATIPIADEQEFHSPTAVRLRGRILLQVEEHGEAWYVNPVNGKRYYLGRPDDAFSIMRTLGLGITTSDLHKLDANVVVNSVLAKGSSNPTAGEYVFITNTGSISQDMTGWKLSDASGHTFAFPRGYTLLAGRSIYVYTNQGELSFGSKTPIWNDDGDTATLRGLNNALIDTYTY